MTRRAAVCIGVDRVVSMDPLSQAASGASAFAQWAADQGCDVALLVDGGEPDVTPTEVARRNVFDAVQAFVARGVYDQLIIYFAGHGILKAPGAEIWLLSDAGNDPNEAVAVVSSVDYARSAGIPHVVFVSDACRVIPTTTALTAITGANIFRWDPAPPDSDPEVDLYYATRPGDPAERELARLRRELKEVTSAPAQSSTDNARHPQHGEEGQDDEHGAP